jgi:predicted MFS family arabinose efflux permease
MPETRDETATGQFDWLGAFVAVLAIGGLAFGVIRGQDRQWQDTTAYVALAIGLVALVAFPILMVRRRHPLVPLALFRRREFATINLSTLLIYGALYVSLYFQGLYFQGVLGYTPLAAGAIGLPVGILLTLFSARVGTVAGRIGARPFLIVGPLLMAAGQLWLVRIPESSQPWLAIIGQPGTLVPPIDMLVDVVPSILLFGIGITLVVAPLTSTLMSSVPVARSGLGSAINNAISRVGQPIISAVIFLVVTGAFYATLADRVPGLDPTSPEVRAQVQPLNPPVASAGDDVRDAARAASTDAFHLAMIVGAGLLAAGAVVNGLGLRGDVPDRDADPAATG